MTSTADADHDRRSAARAADPRRLAAMRRSCLLDTNDNAALNRLTSLATRIIGAPVSLVTLVDTDRQFFAGHAGLPAPFAADPQSPLSHSLCQYVILDRAPVIIPDTALDLRARTNGAYTELGVRAYAGVPLQAPDGELIGSFCALDWNPREWSADDLATLEDIAAAVSAEIESRALLIERDHEQDRLRLLAAIGTELARADGHQQLASAVANLLVPTVCDWCIVELSATIAPHAERPVVVALGTRDEAERATIERMRALARATPQWRSPTVLAATVQRPISLADATFGDFTGGATEDDLPELAALVRETGLRVVSAFPLIADGQAIGAISLIRSDPERGFDEHDLEIHGEIARQLAMAVNAARLSEDLRSRARAAQVIEQLGDGVILLDADHRVMLWNPAMERITGLQAANVLGHPIATALPGLMDAMMDAMVNAGGGASRVVEVTTEHGRRHLAVTGDHADDGGAVFALRDVTDQQRLERTRDEMVATVSHQLRTPVTSVLAAGITLQRTDIQLTDDLREVLVDTIVQQGQRLEELCDDVLLAYRLDNGVHHVHLEPVELDPVIDELLSGLAARGISHTRATVHDSARGQSVIGDAHALRQVFGNLLDNAVKYSPADTSIWIEARTSEDGVDIVIGDRGIGIPVEHHDAIFERFHRLDPDMARGIGGAGLGLFVVRELAQLMNGDVRVESDGADGTRMVVSLPSAVTESAAERM